MPRYRNKQRLKEILASGKEVNSLTHYLILHAGYSYDRAIKGLEPFVDRWEDIVPYIEDSVSYGGDCTDEYEHDLSARTALYDALTHAPEEECLKFRDRIAKADQRFKNATVVYTSPDSHRANLDKDEFWWLFRIIKNNPA